jgi:hypothetical protein
LSSADCNKFTIALTLIALGAAVAFFAYFFQLLETCKASLNTFKNINSNEKKLVREATEPY